MLKDRLGLAKVRHGVVSRFPITTNNSQIIPYSRIDIDSFKSIITHTD